MEDKGLNYLVDAQRRVSCRRDDVYQLIVGIGPQMKSLQARVRRLGLADRIRFTGHRRDIPEILDASDLLVVCSLSEGLSVAIIEAMAAGRAVVATRVGGTPEIVIHDETGLIIEPRDRDALADAILHMAGNPAKRSAMAQRARELAFEKWSVERMVRRFEDIYRALLQERRDRTP
jgi:glycosyltransferase involved in cell wall biosynthesis